MKNERGKLLGDVIKLKLKEANIPTEPYILAEKEFDSHIKRSTLLLIISQILIVAFGFLWLKFYLISDVSLLELSTSLLPNLLIKTLIGAILLKMM